MVGSRMLRTSAFGALYRLAPGSVRPILIGLANPLGIPVTTGVVLNPTEGRHHSAVALNWGGHTVARLLGLTVEYMAEELLWSATKINRMETGAGRSSLPDYFGRVFESRGGPLLIEPAIRRRYRSRRGTDPPARNPTSEGGGEKDAKAQKAPMVGVVRSRVDCRSSHNCYGSQQWWSP